MDLETLLSLTVERLKEELTKVALPITGLKKELQNRLMEYYQLVPTENLDESGGESVYEDTDTRNVLEVDRRRIVRFTLKDVEDSLSTFNGFGSIKVDKWLSDFEEVSRTVKWDDLQRFVYAKQLLKGAAKIFIRSQVHIKDWVSFKCCLIQEFGDEISAIEIHNLLRQRRKKPNETLREYLYSLMEIGSPIEIDDVSIIQYFIEGIPDSRLNKSNLYQATTLKDLKEQIKVYEKIKGDSQKSSSWRESHTSSVTGATSKQHVKVKNEQTCYKCGKEGHMARECNQASITCFKCGKEGHKSYECKGQTKSEVTTKTEKPKVHMMSLTTSKMIFKDIKYKNVSLTALLDTGCDLCLIRNDALLILGDVDILPETISLTAAGGSQIITLGRIVLSVAIDGIEFKTDFHIISERDMQFTAILGNCILNEVDILITSAGAKFGIKSQQSEIIKPQEVVNEQNLVITEVNTEKINDIELRDQIYSNFMCKEFYSICLSAEENELNNQVDVDLSHLEKRVQMFRSF